MTNEIYTAVTIATLVAFYATVLPSAISGLKFHFGMLPSDQKLKYGVITAAMITGCWAVFIAVAMWSPLVGMILSLSGVMFTAVSHVVSRKMTARFLRDMH